MSMDIKVVGVESDNITKNTNYKFLDYIYVSIKSTNDWYKLKNLDHSFLEEENDDELRAFDSYIYDKNHLIKFIKENQCELYDNLLELIKETKYDYIILQNF